MTKICKTDKNNLIDLFFKVSCPKSKTSRIIGATVKKGLSILAAAHSPAKLRPKNADIPLEGACEGSLACSTCHVILDKNLYPKTGNPSDKEYDLLDSAFNPTSRSRLGCQVIIDGNFKDKIIEIPKATKNFAVDGFFQKHH